MTDRRVEQVQPMGHADLAEAGAGCAAMDQIDPVYILHQLNGLFPADIFIESAAEIIGDIILAIGESAGAAESIHDGTGLAADAACDLVPVNRALPFLQHVAGLKDRDLQIRPAHCQLISRINPARTGTDDQYIIFLHISLLLPFFSLIQMQGNESLPSANCIIPEAAERRYFSVRVTVDHELWAHLLLCSPVCQL